MNRRGFLTGLASLVVPVPSLPAPFTVNMAGRAGGIRMRRVIEPSIDPVTRAQVEAAGWLFKTIVIGDEITQ